MRVGPIRFNISKSGLGASVGVKGLRIGTGPRGNYIHAGTGGFYYRKTLNDQKSRNPKTELHESHHKQEEEIEALKGILGQETFDSNFDTLLQNSSHDELIQEINDKSSKITFWKWSLGTILFSAIFLGADVLFSLAALPLIYFWDQNRKSVVLLYDFDEPQESIYKEKIKYFEDFMQVDKLWTIQTQVVNKDHKRNAGASTLINRSSASCSIKSPTFIKSNIPIPTLTMKSQTFCFLPDKLIVLGSKEAISVEYKDLAIEINATRMIEDSTPPRDAEVVDHTWRYVNKSGKPDKRFKDNRKLPICSYDEISFSTLHGLNAKIHISKKDQFTNFKKVILSQYFKIAS